MANSGRSTRNVARVAPLRGERRHGLIVLLVQMNTPINAQHSKASETYHHGVEVCGAVRSLYAWHHAQHFVPKCLLPRFSQSEQTTSAFVIGTATFVRTAGIKTQCAADYYYGHEQTIETNLERMESAFSSAIGDLSVETIEGMGENELAAVRSFFRNLTTPP